MSTSTLSIILYERPKYTTGSGPPMLPVTLALPHNNNTYFIADKIVVNKILTYVISRHGNPAFRQACRPDRVLDWVSRKAYEDFEYELTKAADQDRRDEEDAILNEFIGTAQQKQKVGRAKKRGTTKKHKKKNEIPKTATRVKGAVQKQELHGNVGRRAYSAESNVVADTENSDQATSNQDEANKRGVGKRRKHQMPVDSVRREPASKRRLILATPSPPPQRKSIHSSGRSQPSLSRPAFQEDMTDTEEDGFVYGAFYHGIPSRLAVQPPKTLPRSTRSTSKATVNSESTSQRVFKSSSKEERPTARKIPRLSSNSSSLVAPLNFNPSPNRNIRKRSPSLTTTSGNLSRPISSKSQHSHSPANSHFPTTSALYRSTSVSFTHPKKSRPKKKKPQEEPEWTLKRIIGHEIRKVQGRDVLFYLVDWECDYEGQWDPSWEPAENVSDDSKADYHKALQDEEGHDIGKESAHSHAMTENVMDTMAQVQVKVSRNKNIKDTSSKGEEISTKVNEFSNSSIGRDNDGQGSDTTESKSEDDEDDEDEEQASPSNQPGERTVPSTKTSVKYLDDKDRILSDDDFLFKSNSETAAMDMLQSVSDEDEMLMF